MTKAELELPADLRDARPTAKVCYFVLATTNAPLSQTELRQRAGCPERSVRRAIKTLLNEGHANEVIEPTRPNQTLYALRD